MADKLTIGLTEHLRKAHIQGDAEFLKEGVRALSQALMEMEVEEHIGTAGHERTPGAQGSAQRLPPEDLGHEGGSCGTLGAEGEGR